MNDFKAGMAYFWKEHLWPTIYGSALFVLYMAGAVVILTILYTIFSYTFNFLDLGRYLP